MIHFEECNSAATFRQLCGSLPPPTSPRSAPITLAMYDRMIAAGVFAPAETHPLEPIA
jgi:hypothetical protein